MEDYLCHHGVRGMKWGKRKQKTSSGIKRTGSKKKISEKSKKILSDANKQKIKKVAKTAAVAAGGIATAAALAAVGSMAWKNYVDSHTLGPVANAYIDINGKRRYMMR